MALSVENSYVPRRRSTLITISGLSSLTGAGRAFGAGADLSDTSEPMPNGGEGVEDQLNAEYKPGVLAIHHARKPWIAAINGPCAGISYSFAMACDLVVMAESSFLYQPFLGIGLVP